MIDGAAFEGATAPVAEEGGSSLGRPDSADGCPPSTRCGGRRPARLRRLLFTLWLRCILAEVLTESAAAVAV